MPCLKQILAAVAVCGWTSVAMAQYVWLDDKGVKQYSDVPPPVSVPSSRILKSPGSLPRADEAETGDEQQQAQTAEQSLAAQNAAFEKRRIEQAEQQKKTAEKAKQEAAQRDNCERARNYAQALASGQRIAQFDASGERHYLSDAERAKEAADVQRTLANCH